MLTKIHLQNFTVFADATFEFSPGLNVLVGTNGTGKSHVLKVGYAVTNVGSGFTDPNKQQVSFWGTRWGYSLRPVISDCFLVELDRLVNEKKDTSTVAARLEEFSGDVVFEIARHFVLTRGAFQVLSEPDSAKKEVGWPVFIPPKEVLSFYEGFRSLYAKREISFDSTYYDLTIQLGLPLLREARIGAEEQAQLAALEKAMGGTIKIEGEQVYFVPTGSTDRLPINLYAEGLRKFGTLWQLLRNGSLTPETTLFWDEPEANLNPALLRKLAAVLAALARQGFQIILATHSLFLLKELHILSRQKEEKPLPIRYFGLYAGPDGATQVDVADELPMLPTIAALDAEVQQSGEYLTLANADDDYAD